MDFGSYLSVLKVNGTNMGLRSGTLEEVITVSPLSMILNNASIKTSEIGISNRSSRHVGI